MLNIKLGGKNPELIYLTIYLNFIQPLAIDKNLTSYYITDYNLVKSLSKFMKLLLCNDYLHIYLHVKLRQLYSRLNINYLTN